MLENPSEMVSALFSFRLVKLATPPATVTVVVPSSGPLPIANAAVTVVDESPVSRLPNASST